MCLQGFINEMEKITGMMVEAGESDVQNKGMNMSHQKCLTVVGTNMEFWREGQARGMDLGIVGI